MAKTLLIYYSLTGTTKKVAEEMARQAGWDVGVIKDKKPRNGRLGYMRSGMEMIFPFHPAIEYQGNDPSAYDLVVLGSPIWMGKLSSPLHSFIKREGVKLKNVALFCTMGGDEVAGALAQFTLLVGHAPQCFLAVNERAVASGAFQEKIKPFVEQANNRLSIAA